MKKFLLLSIMVCCCSAVFSPSVFAQKNVRNSVVKVFVTSNRADFHKPWQSVGSESSTGSGCIISNNRILTNAHVVANNTFIQVRKESSPKKFTARAVAIGHDCDLAILEVDDPGFFEDVQVVPFGDLPVLRDKVTVIGFPLGGDKLSITEGVVSRIEVVPYAQSAKRLLGVQIDAAINPGNSGGPVFQDGKLVGIAMQLMSKSQNIGYMIPVPVINHFLDDLLDGRYDGFPFLGIEYHSTENKALRDYYQINEKDTGVVITNIQPFTSAENIFKKGDVVLEVDGVSIAEDGTFDFRNGERLSFSHIIHQKHLGESLKIKLLRNGKAKEKEVVFKNSHHLIPPPNFIKHPSYYIYGGLVFTVLTTDLLKSWGDKWWERSPFDFMYFLIGNGRLNKERRKEVVVLLNVLPDDKNIGYLGFNNQVIVSVNGKFFSSFKEFVLLLESVKDEHVIFETLDGTKMVISSKEIGEITDKIIGRNNILRRYSQDVEEWL